jgi:CHAT domain-containing protein/Tfp pilus assembly protein PilF
MAQCVDERKAEVDRLNGQSIQKVQDSEALNLVKQGEEEFQQGQSQKAFETFKEALKLARELKDRYAEGEALNNIAFIYNSLGQSQKALEINNQALSIRRELGDRKEEGITLNNIGEVYFGLGQFDKAFDYFSQAVTIFEEIGNDNLVTTSINNMNKTLSQKQQEVSNLQEELNLTNESLKLRKQGRQQIEKGQYQEAIKTYQQVLVIGKKLKDKETEASALRMLALSHDNLKNYQQALDYYKQVLALDRELGDQESVVNSLNGIGSIYNSLNQHEKAIEILQEALRIAKKVNYQDGELNALSILALSQEALFQNEQALDNLNQALSILKKKNDLSGQINVLGYISSVYKQMGKYKKALEYLNQSLSISQKINDSSKIAFTLDSIGSIYNNIGQRKKALEYLEKALSMRKKINDRQGIGETLNKIGVVHNNLGQYEKAMDYLEKALSIRREVKDCFGEAITLGNIGSLQNDMGQSQKALENVNQSLEILKGLNSNVKLGSALNLFGTIYDRLGEYQKALDYYNQSLSVRQKVGDRNGEAVTLNNRGSLYDTIGQTQRGLTDLNSALKIYQEVGDRNGEATDLNNISLIYEREKNFLQALKNLSKALLIHQQVGDISGEIVALHNIGYLYDKMGNSPKALKIFNEALSKAIKMDFLVEKANILSSIGMVYGKLKNPQKALENLNEALLIQKQTGDHYSEAITLKNLGDVYQDLDEPTKAIEVWEKSVNIGLEMRKGFQKEHRRAFMESDIPKFTAIALIDLLIKQKQPQKAFEWANRVTTFDLAEYNRLIGFKVANPETQKEIDQWNELNISLTSLLSQQQENIRQGKYSIELAKQINEIQAQVNIKAETIAQTYPEVAELFETKPTDIAQLQKNIAPDTLVIQPVPLRDKIALFLLTKDKLTVIKSNTKADEFNQLINTYRNQISDRKNADYLDTSSQLYEILIRPIEQQIKSNSPKNLAIIATNRLRYIPFESLYDSKTNQYLLQKYPISYLTRISTYRSLKNTIFSPIILDYIIFGTLVIFICIAVVFTIRKFGIISGLIVFSLSLGIVIFLNFIPSNNLQPNRALALANPKPTNQELKGTEKEAENLLKIFPQSESYLGEKATLDTFKTQASRFAILHLGTHGCFERDGCVNPKMQANTILFANNQQYNIADAALLGLKNTELITLSACQTAKEANANGQEISGLAYVLERAGAKSVIASLWNADDNTSAEIMTQFYQNLQKGMTKSEAMQKAKLSQIEENPKPYFWSPFILIGDAQ